MPDERPDHLREALALAGVVGRDWVGGRVRRAFLAAGWAMSVAVLFTIKGGHYEAMPVEAFDIERDARTFDLSCPVVAHPPCRGWSRLRSFAKPRADERDLAVWAVWVVRHCGGVLEHPSGSALWRFMGLPHPSRPTRDAFGGWSLPVSQKWWGHRAEKRTWLYICGIDPCEVPAMPLDLAEAQRTCGLWSGRDRATCRKGIGEVERMATPPAFGAWLVELAGLARAAA